MLSLEQIRNETDAVRAALVRRAEDDDCLDEILALDTERRVAITDGDNLRSRRNQVSREIGQARAQGQQPPDDVVAEMRDVGQQISDLEETVRTLDVRINGLLMELPNLPDATTLDGLDESANRVLRHWGELPQFDFAPQPHWDLAEQLGVIDFQRGVKLSGSRFYTLNGRGARLERAIISWMLDLHSEEHGYTEMALPILVRREIMEGSGNLPRFADNLYHDEEDDLWLIPTAEVPVTNLHRDEILSADELPLYYVAHTPCFRREKAAAGRDTRGIKRVHQFNKVEMYKFVEPGTSFDELETLLGNAETVCQRLGLPYRILELCAGDISFPSAKSYDIEVWAAGSGEWLEVSSCSNCTDFQARRANVRYRPAAGERPRFVHTLNGSGLALPRVMIAILENNQQPDGSVIIPEPLHPYTGFDTIPAP
ncbi:Serine--tRNA ligase [Geodia barretti]|uniref:Serine--tRNA ligase n=1 Tax=Geodia barretti TaxID=519541 RepID=A0AA35S4S9_GEOBA|nr:Serine--tRNA ligase [Geodia barretti]